jgi:hypothetical protein
MTQSRHAPLDAFLPIANHGAGGSMPMGFLGPRRSGFLMPNLTELFIGLE